MPESRGTREGSRVSARCARGPVEVTSSGHQSSLWEAEERCSKGGRREHAGQWEGSTGVEGALRQATALGFSVLNGTGWPGWGVPAERRRRGARPWAGTGSRRCGC